MLTSSAWEELTADVHPQRRRLTYSTSEGRAEAYE